MCNQVLRPHDCADLAAVECPLLADDNLYNKTARPFAWPFAREDVARRLTRRDVARAA